MGAVVEAQVGEAAQEVDAGPLIEMCPGLSGHRHRGGGLLLHRARGAGRGSLLRGGEGVVVALEGSQELLEGGAVL